MTDEFKLFVFGLLILGAFGAGWETNSWRNGAKQTAAVTAQLKQVSDSIASFDKDEKATLQEDTVVSGKVDNLATSSAKIQQEISSENLKLANPVAAGCINPFTPDFLRLLNSNPTTAAPSATTGSGPR